MIHELPSVCFSYHEGAEAVIRLTAEKSEKVRLRTREAIASLQQQGKSIHFSIVGEAARVSKTFLYDPRHADLAEEIRWFRQNSDNILGKRVILLLVSSDTTVQKGLQTYDRHVRICMLRDELFLAEPLRRTSCIRMLMRRLVFSGTPTAFSCPAPHH